LPAGTIADKEAAQKRPRFSWVASLEARAPKRPPTWVVVRLRVARWKRGTFPAVGQTSAPYGLRRRNGQGFT
jgi:hypothetical protein